MTQDVILRGTLGGEQARVLFANTTALVEQARRIHNLSPTATAALGRVLTGAALMAQTLKEDDHGVTLTVKGGGPVGTLMAVARKNGAVKGYAAHPEADVPPRAEGKLDVGGLVGADGTLSVAREGDAGEPYVGHSRLRNGEIAEDLAWYYAVSEQQPSLVALGVLVGTEGQVLAAGGLLVQPLPGCGEELLQDLETRAPVWGDISRHLEDFGDAEELLTAMMRGLGLTVTQRTQPVFRCDCSPERVRGALVALGPDTLKEMAAEENTQVYCQFCAKEYNITGREIHNLYETARRKGDMANDG